MNEFYLVLIKNNGEIIHNIFATSYKDLISKYITPDDELNKTYIKARFSPKEGFNLNDIEDYKLFIDEVYIPEWYKGKFVEDTIIKLENIIQSMIISGHKQLLLHEGAILCDNAVIDETKHSVIFAMYDNARIKIADSGSVIQHMTDESFIDELRDNAKIDELWGYAKVREMHDYSKVIKMYGQAKIGKMFEHSHIATLKGDANILEMRDMSKADRLRHMSKVDEMHNHSTIEEMWEWTIVEKMFDQSRINYMDEDSRVLEMFGDSTIEEMYGNAIVERLCENSLVRKLHEAAKVLKKELK
jgi:hypothetical protein